MWPAAVVACDCGHPRGNLWFCWLKLPFPPLLLFHAEVNFENWWVNVRTSSLCPKIIAMHVVHRWVISLQIHWLFEEIAYKIFVVLPGL
jgi:hypothetical protein